VFSCNKDTVFWEHMNTICTNLKCFWLGEVQESFVNLQKPFGSFWWRLGLPTTDLTVWRMPLSGNWVQSGFRLGALRPVVPRKYDKLERGIYIPSLSLLNWMDNSECYMYMYFNMELFFSSLCFAVTKIQYFENTFYMNLKGFRLFFSSSWFAVPKQQYFKNTWTHSVWI
jgi:hypothetical protein